MAIILRSSRAAGAANGLTNNEIDGNFTDLDGRVTTNTTAVAAKQATLVSGTNIRTVNGNTLLGSTDLVISGGVTTYAALTDAASVNLPTTNTPLSSALGLKANAASPVLTGVVTHSGADQVAGTAVATNIVDFNAGKNVQPTLTGATTVTFANSATDRSTLWRITGHATTAFVVTLPASVRSVGQQAVIGSFTVPANWQGYLSLVCTGAGTFDLAGEPVALADKGVAGRFGTGANDTQVVVLSSPYAGTITSFKTQSASGTATFQLVINATNVTGASNAVSSTLVSNTPSAANVVAVGDKISIVRTADATCVNADFTVVIAPSKA